MRPAGEVREALLKAAGDLATPTRAGTLTELATRACVGLDAARRTLDNLKRGGLLKVPRTREVPYRNRPVAEYEPADPAPAIDPAHHDVARALSLWVQR